MGDLKPVQMLAASIQAVSILSIRACCLQPRERVGPFVVAAPGRGFVVTKHVTRVVHLITASQALRLYVKHEQNFRVSRCEKISWRAAHFLLECSDLPTGMATVLPAASPAALVKSANLHSRLLATQRSKMLTSADFSPLLQCPLRPLHPRRPLRPAPTKDTRTASHSTNSGNAVHAPLQYASEAAPDSTRASTCAPVISLLASRQEQHSKQASKPWGGGHPAANSRGEACVQLLPSYPILLTEPAESALR